MASRYNSYDSRSSTSSYFSDPSSSAEANFKPSAASRAIIQSKPSDLPQVKSVKSKSNDHHLSTMVKKFMEKKSTSSASSSSRIPANGSSKKTVGALVIPSDLIAEDLKKAARKGTGFMGLQKKLFGKEKKEVKALIEVKGNSGNTRTLAMVLRSERELLSANKEQEEEIARLKLMLEDKNREVEKLKDLCLKQREEIKSLKSAILFPDVMNSQLQELLERQGSELKQAKQLIPTLQEQVTSLTGQLQCLAEDLAEVKADKFGKSGIQHRGNSPMTPMYNHEQTANSLVFSSCDGDSETLGSPDDMFLKDLNPCLTPYCSKTKSKEFEAMGYDSPFDESFSDNNTQMHNELSFSSRSRNLSKSSDTQSSNKGRIMAWAARKSDESKSTYGKQMYQRLF